MPPNIIQILASVLGIGHLQVVHNLLINYTICVGFTLARRRGLVFQYWDVWPCIQILYKYMFRSWYWTSSGCSQLINQLYYTRRGLLSGGGGRDEISTCNVGRYGHASLYN